MVPRKLAGMMTYQVLALIFDRQAKRLAAAFGIKETSAARYLRDPLGSGAPNPLDRLCRMIDEAVLANREQSGLLIEFLRQYHLRLIHGSRKTDFSPAEAARRILQTSTSAVSSLALETTAPDAQMRALIEARAALDETILQLEGQAGDQSSI